MIVYHCANQIIFKSINCNDTHLRPVHKDLPDKYSIILQVLGLKDYKINSYG